jgi:hypothetical protein
MGQKVDLGISKSLLILQAYLEARNTNLVNPLEPILRHAGLRCRHYPGVIVKYVYSAVAFQPSLIEGVDATQICHINRPLFDYRRRMAIRLGDVFAFFHRSRRMEFPLRRLPTGEDQVRAPRCERFGSFKSNAVVRSRDNNPLSAQIG